VRHIFDEALEALIRNKTLIEEMGFIDLIVPGFDGHAEALRKFEAAEVNKVVFKPAQEESR